MREAQAGQPQPWPCKNPSSGIFLFGYSAIILEDAGEIYELDEHNIYLLIAYSLVNVLYLLRG